MDFRDAIYPRIAGIFSDKSVIADNAVFDFAAPLDQKIGRDAIWAGFYEPLLSALQGVHRRDILFIGGDNIRDAGGQWVASVTHYVGNFTAPLFGIAPSNHLVFLRAGEFYRIENNQITEAKIIFDLPDLLRQCGRAVFPHDLGAEMVFPAPMTQDGIKPTQGDGANSIKIMEGMFSDLGAFNPRDFSSNNQTGDDGYWHRDMMWYGPGGIGSNFQWQGFVNDHRSSFLTAFPDRKGGNHYCRLGDGYYSAASGWPSMTMTFQGDYLGVRADGRALTLRVMDFYRCDRRQICENWVCLDYGDLMRQMGVDILAVAVE